MDRSTYYEELKMTSQSDCRPDRIVYKDNEQNQYKLHWQNLYDFCQLEEIPDAFEVIYQPVQLDKLEPLIPPLKVRKSRFASYYTIFITISLGVLYGNDQLHLLTGCELFQEFRNELKEVTYVTRRQDKENMSFMTELADHKAKLNGFESLCTLSQELNEFRNTDSAYFESIFA